MTTIKIDDVFEWAKLVVKYLLPSGPMKSLNVRQKTTIIVNIVGDLTLAMSRAAIECDYQSLIKCVAVLLNMRSDITRQHWYIDESNRLEYRDLVELCDKCHMHIVDDTTPIADVMVCAKCRSGSDNAD